MAWVATDNFDGYSTGVDLNTLNGGSGWSGAWSTSAGDDITAETAPAGGQGGNAALSNGVNGNTVYVRALANVSVGTALFRMRISINNPADFCGIILRETGSGKMYVKFGSSGNIEVFNNDVAGYQTVQAYSVNTWYTVEVDFDNGAQANQYRVRIDGGTYTAYKTVNGGSYTNINEFNIDNSAAGAHDFWIDDIKPGTAEGGSATLMGAILM